MKGKSKQHRPAAGKKKDKAKPQESAEEAAEHQAVDANAVQDDVGAETDGDKNIAEVEDRLLRLHADFDNFRKRTSRERQSLKQSALQDLMLELLTVLDNLDLALEASQNHDGDCDAFAEGYEMVAGQFMGVLTRFGLSRIETAGIDFDPNLHEAVSHLPSADHPEGQVVAEVRKGYLLNGKLLRPPRVVVSSGPAEDPQEAGEA